MSKQAALGFAKRTLTRCRNYEVTGKSCFSDPPLRDIIFAPPPRNDVKELLTGANLTVANGENVNPINAAIAVGNCVCHALIAVSACYFYLCVSCSMLLSLKMHL